MNSGKRPGDEVVQLYVQHLNSAVQRPIRELRGFKRVTLQPGEETTVQIPLTAKSLAYWNVASHSFEVEHGKRLLLGIGASSTDIRLDKTIKVE